MFGLGFLAGSEFPDSGVRVLVSFVVREFGSDAVRVRVSGSGCSGSCVRVLGIGLGRSDHDFRC